MHISYTKWNKYYGIGAIILFFNLKQLTNIAKENREKKVKLLLPLNIMTVFVLYYKVLIYVLGNIFQFLNLGKKSVLLLCFFFFKVTTMNTINHFFKLVPLPLRSSPSISDYDCSIISSVKQYLFNVSICIYQMKECKYL